MIDPLPAVSSPVAIGPTAPAAKAVASVGPSKFGQTLAAFLDSRDAARDPDPVVPDGKDRHDAAADGNSLPSDTDAADGAPPIWMTPSVPVPASTAEPAVSADGVPVGGVASSSPTIRPATPIVTVGSPAQGAADSEGAAIAQRQDDASGLAAAGAASNPDARPVLPPLDPSITAALDGALTRASAARQEATPPAPATADGPQPLARVSADAANTAIIANAVPQPAGRVFAAALATAWRDRSQRSDDSDASTGTIPLGGAAPTQASNPAIVQAASNASQSGLDLTQDTGLQRMIAHIETLRDDADARDTRIRLVPDALGGVDVAVRQVGDRVHVHFTAEQEATRALIADAQPRLTELAAARGMRIGDTSVSADSGSGNGAAPQPRPALPITPAPRALAEETETPSDARVA